MVTEEEESEAEESERGTEKKIIRLFYYLENEELTGRREEDAGE